MFHLLKYDLSTLSLKFFFVFLFSGQINPNPYSPSAHNGSVSSGVDNGFSDESDEDNNGHLVQ
jgi:hypothetical protein